MKFGFMMEIKTRYCMIFLNRSVINDLMPNGGPRMPVIGLGWFGMIVHNIKSIIGLIDFLCFLKTCNPRLCSMANYIVLTCILVISATNVFVDQSGLLVEALILRKWNIKYRQTNVFHQGESQEILNDSYVYRYNYRSLKTYM